MKWHSFECGTHVFSTGMFDAHLVTLACYSRLPLTLSLTPLSGKTKSFEENGRWHSRSPVKYGLNPTGLRCR